MLAALPPLAQHPSSHWKHNLLRPARRQQGWLGGNGDEEAPNVVCQLSALGSPNPILFPPWPLQVVALL